MNKEFQQYVTGNAFVLTLSQPQIEALAWVAMGSKAREEYPNVPNLVSMQSLRRRGLIIWPRMITKEGELVLQLCEHAGLVKLALARAA